MAVISAHKKQLRVYLEIMQSLFRTRDYSFHRYLPLQCNWFLEQSEVMQVHFHINSELKTSRASALNVPP